jgi:hypothetical protein
MKFWLNSNGDNGVVFDAKDVAGPCHPVGIVLIVIICIVMTLSLILIPYGIDKKWKEDHRTGVYQCPKCQSYKTEGFNTFWYKDGMLCNGSREYNLEHAHYTIMSCDYCGNDWRLYKKDW